MSLNSLNSDYRKNWLNPQVNNLLAYGKVLDVNDNAAELIGITISDSVGVVGNTSVFFLYKSQPNTILVSVYIELCILSNVTVDTTLLTLTLASPPLHLPSSDINWMNTIGNNAIGSTNFKSTGEPIILRCDTLTAGTHTLHGMSFQYLSPP